MQLTVVPGADVCVTTGEQRPGWTRVNILGWTLQAPPPRPPVSFSFFF